MNVTSTGIAVALAVIVVLGFFMFGFSNPFTTIETPVEQGATTTPTTTTNTGEFMITDIETGTGAEAKTGDTIAVNYVGRFENGTIFDASANHGGPFEFQLGVDPVIQGWQQGLVGMKVGGKRQLVIPPELGYGPNDYGQIPGNSTLLFEVELVNIISSQ